MARKREKKEPPKPLPRVHGDLKGFEMSIDSFGEIHSSMPIEKINEFLDRTVPDKKLEERDDYEEIKKGTGRKKSKGKKK
jgi:hypothetical protein